MLWVIAFFAFISSAIVFIPNLSATLKTFGLPHDWPSIQEIFNPSKQPLQLDPDSPQKIPVRITPIIENQDFNANTVTLNLSVEALEKNCTAEVDPKSERFVFLVACDGGIGDKISFVLSSEGCTDEKVDAKLAYDKEAYIQCP